MDKTTIANASSAELALEIGAPELAQDAGRSEVRPLGDWELVLVGGGDNVPNW